MLLVYNLNSLLLVIIITKNRLSTKPAIPSALSVLFQMLAIRTTATS